MKIRLSIPSLALLFAIVFLWTMNVSAAMWGAGTSAATAYAPSYWTDFNYDSDGGQGEAYSYSSINDARGHGAAMAMLGLAPILKAESYHTSNSFDGVRANASVIEKYIFSGAATQEMRLNIDLTGIVYNSGSSDAFVSAEVYVISSQGFEYYTDPGTLFYEIGAQLMEGELYEEGASMLNLYLDDSSRSESGQIVFDVDPNESFYILALLNTRAEWNHSYADAFNTLELYFDDTTNLTAGSTVVPLPGALWLFVSGLAGLSFFRRKNNP